MRITELIKPSLTCQIKSDTVRFLLLNEIDYWLFLAKSSPLLWDTWTMHKYAIYSISCYKMLHGWYSITKWSQSKTSNWNKNVLQLLTIATQGWQVLENVSIIAKICRSLLYVMMVVASTCTVVSVYLCCLCYLCICVSVLPVLSLRLCVCAVCAVFFC